MRAIKEFLYQKSLTPVRCRFVPMFVARSCQVLFLLLHGFGREKTFNLFGRTVRLPTNHVLPLLLHRHPRYARNLIELAQQLEAHAKQAAIIDIGGNIGDTAVILRQHRIAAPILSIEGDDYYFGLLQENTRDLADFTAHKQFVGEHEQTVQGKVVHEAGNAFVAPSPDGQISFLPLAQLLPPEWDATRKYLLKLDAEGYDIPIMRGALETISQLKPILFFEYNSLNGGAEKLTKGDSKTFAHLFDKGYTHGLLWYGTGEFMFSFRLDDAQFLRELRQYFFAQPHLTYMHFADIALFHADDEAIFEAMLAQQLSTQQA